MKWLTVLLIALFTCSAQCKDKDIASTPELVEFRAKVAADAESEFKNIEKQLLATKKEELYRDHKLEALSGFVWNIDRKRARALLKHIQNKKLKEQIQRQYKAMEQADPEESQTI